MSDPSEPLSRNDPDLDVFRLARSGDFAAFERLLERFQDRVYALAVRILGEPHDAEDVVQQTFLSLIEHLGDFREESAVSAWVLRIAANHALKMLRKKRGLPIVALSSLGEPNEPLDDVPHPQFIAPWKQDPAELAERHEVRELIDQALADLDDKYRAVFVLRDVEGFSVRETAELLQVSEANVKVRLLRARLALRERLTRLVGDEAARVFSDHHHLPSAPRGGEQP